MIAEKPIDQVHAVENMEREELTIVALQNLVF